MTETAVPWLGLLCGAITLFQGLRMVRRPQAYIGPRRFDASDPKTVRFFGGLSLFFGAALLLLNLIVLVAGGPA